MNREDDVIELGTASTETKGADGNISDLSIRQKVNGLTDD